MILKSGDLSSDFSGEIRWLV